MDGTDVFVSEGFPLALARKLRDSITSVQSSAPLQLAESPAKVRSGRVELPAFDPGVSLVRMFLSAGVMKAALTGVCGR
jgi:hypothetical protein